MSHEILFEFAAFAGVGVRFPVSELLGSFQRFLKDSLQLEDG